MLVARLIFYAGVYLVVGSGVNACWLKKRGLEIIPNYRFWIEVPSLIRVSQHHSYVIIHGYSGHLKVKPRSYEHQGSVGTLFVLTRFYYSSEPTRNILVGSRAQEDITVDQ